MIHPSGYHAIKPWYFSRQDWAEAGVHGSHRSGVQHSHWSGFLDILSSDWLFDLNKLIQQLKQYSEQCVFINMDCWTLLSKVPCTGMRPASLPSWLRNSQNSPGSPQEAAGVSLSPLWCSQQFWSSSHSAKAMERILYLNNQQSIIFTINTY